MLLTCIGAARAAEGFFVGDRPPAVAAAWASVYAFVCERPGGTYTATAFLVHKTARSRGRADYYFITAGHAVEDCRRARSHLAGDINQPRFERDGITLAAQPRRLDGITPVLIDEAYDLAIVKVTASGTLPIGKPIPIDGRCNDALHREIFSIGFPGVGQRRSLKLKREVKRWSRGEYVGLGRAEFRGGPAIHIAATVDSLPGSSGGPALDARGALVGVVVKGAAAAENGYRYDVDPKKRDDWQTFLVPCQAVLEILHRAGL